MMKIIRWVLGKVILFLNAVFAPRPMPRSAAEKAALDARTAQLALFQYETCPFCVRVRRAIQRLNLDIPLRDAKESAAADELRRGGGELQVPCLRIPEENGKVRWLYESNDIIRYLEQTYGRRALS